MNEFDLRQLTKMQQQISSYESGNIGLQVLINDLIFLRDALSEVEQEWEFEFTGYIVDLESAYSYALEKNSGKLEAISQKVVGDALPNLLTLIENTKIKGGITT